MGVRRFSEGVPPRGERWFHVRYGISPFVLYHHGTTYTWSDPRHHELLEPCDVSSQYVVVPWYTESLHRISTYLLSQFDTASRAIPPHVPEGFHTGGMATNARPRSPQDTSTPSGTERGRCPVIRWRDVGQEGVMSVMAPLLAQNRPILMSGYWTQQVLRKDAAHRWRSFVGIKQTLSAYGLDQLRESESESKDDAGDERLG